MNTKLEQVWIFENGRYIRQYWRVVSNEGSASIDGSEDSIELTAKAS